MQIIFLIVFLTAGYSCGKSDSEIHNNDAVIVGWVNTYCPEIICGGFLVNLENDTVNHGSAGYHAIWYPVSLVNNLSGRHLPIYIHMTWKQDSDTTRTLIDILSLNAR